MKSKKFIICSMIVCLVVVLSNACGGTTAKSSNSTNSTNADNANNAVNSNANSAEKTEKKTVDTTPVKMTSDELGAKTADDLKQYKGRTLILYGQLEKWTTGEMEISMGSHEVNCSGDYIEYMDAIELYEKKTKRAWINFRGVLEEAKQDGFDAILTMKDCVITNIEK